MLKSEVGFLADKCGLSKATIYRVAEKLNLNLRPFYGRCDKTMIASPVKRWTENMALGLNLPQKK